MLKRRGGMKDRSSSASQDKVILTQDSLLLALKDSRPSVSEKERMKYSNM